MLGLRTQDWIRCPFMTLFYPQAQRRMRNNDPNTLLHHLPVRANVDGHLTGTIIIYRFYTTKIYNGDIEIMSCLFNTSELWVEKSADSLLFLKL